MRIIISILGYKRPKETYELALEVTRQVKETIHKDVEFDFEIRVDRDGCYNKLKNSPDLVQEVTIYTVKNRYEFTKFVQSQFALGGGLLPGVEIGSKRKDASPVVPKHSVKESPKATLKVIGKKK